MSFDIYAGMLRMMDIFRAECGAAIRYRFDDPAYQTLRERYALVQTAGEGGGFSRAVRVLEWLSAHIFHKGDFGGGVPEDALSYLAYGFDGGARRGINCRCLSVTLTECLLACGIAARTVFLMPFSPYDCDNHVVCEAYVPERGKWVLLDPTYRGYLTDENGAALSVLELRRLLGERGRFCLSGSFSYNGEPVGDLEDLRAYYAKNLFYLQVLEEQGPGSLERGECRSLYFAPAGYDTLRSALTTIDYRVAQYGPSPYFDRWRERELRTERYCCGAAVLERAPGP